jgi:uncharacterized repeat protein (TIGR03837 family)
VIIDILCRVVDNFGDIGVVYRLARALSELEDAPALRLIVDDLDAFSRLCPGVESGAPLQSVGCWTVVDWSGASAGLFRAERPRAVVECFACGRPDWYEEILFDPADPEDRLIVNLEYLTAEAWAEDFHRLPSVTRSLRVRKAMFMPGFAAGTGGLIQDRRFMALREAYADGEGRPALRRALFDTLGLPAPPGAEDRFWVSIFSYERDYAAVVGDLADFARTEPLLVFSAAGRSSVPFLGAWEAAGRPFPVVDLPFLNQESWDELLLAADFAVVRGEESLSRAALGGRPFLWHAYIQEGDHQLLKVRALLERIRPFADEGDWDALERLSLAFNDRSGSVGPGMFGAVLRLAAEGGPFRRAFSDWSASVVSVGNLASALLTFIREFG